MSGTLSDSARLATTHFVVIPLRADIERLSPPSSDKRWKLVQARMRKHGYQANALIETLHSVNETFGYLEKNGLRYVASALRVPLSRVYGVATFYHYFTLKPPGKHNCVICVGTACYIRGAKNLLSEIKDTVELAPGETTGDGKVSLVTARCLGSCGLAPNGVFDGEVVGKLTVPQVRERVAGWLKHES